MRRVTGLVGWLAGVGLAVGVCGVARAEAVDWEAQGRAWAREAVTLVDAIELRDLDAQTLAEVQADVLTQAVFCQARLGDSEGLEATVERRRGFVDQEPKVGEFGDLAWLRIRAALGDWEQAGLVWEQIERKLEADEEVGLGWAVQARTAIPLARGMEGSTGAMRAGLKPIYGELFARLSDGGRSGKEALSAVHLLIEGQARAGDLSGALAYHKRLPKAAKGALLRRELMRVAAMSGDRLSLERLLAGAWVDRDVPLRFGLVVPMGVRKGEDPMKRPDWLAWHAERDVVIGLAALGRWPEAEPRLRSLLEKCEAQHHVFERFMIQLDVASVMVSNDESDQRRELLTDAFRAARQQDWPYILLMVVGRKTASVGDAEMAEWMLEQTEDARERAWLLVGLADGAGKRMWRERRERAVN